MKRYIIIGTFFDMGGGQLYTRNKVDYLKNHGWQVDVYTGRAGKLLLPEMKEYTKNYYKELSYNPYYISRKRRNKIIDKIIGNNIFDETVIETSKYNESIWGELIAHKIKAKHVLFNLDEEFPVYDKWEYEYLDFKHKRRELACINPVSMQKLFGKYKIVNKNENYNLNFICRNQISDSNNDIMKDIKKEDINFGCISRLDKGYIMPMFNEVKKFVLKHPEYKISFILVGDSNDKTKRSSIKNLFSDIKNIRLYFMGYLSPIPKALIDFVDYFIGTAGSAVMTAKAGKITIAVDTTNCTPIGIIDYDVSSGTFSNGDIQISLNDYLEDLIFHTDFKKIKKKLSENQKSSLNYMTEFDNHMKFIDSSEMKKEYFPFEKSAIKKKVLFFLIQIIGFERLLKFKTIVKKMIGPKWLLRIKSLNKRNREKLKKDDK